jgi:tetratricopeptide (TPR) repeat protein
LIEVVRQAAEIADEDAPETAMARLLELVDFDIEVADRVASVVGLSKSSYQMGELFWGIRRLFEYLAASRPIVVLFDDIHWAEQTFLDLVEYLTEAIRGAALVILCTARNELLETHPTWGEQDRSARIVLKPLSDADAARVVENLLGQTGLADEVRARIVAAAEGNPLFVEQLLSMLIESGRLVERADGWTSTSDLSDLAIPPTIHALLAARLDALPQPERAVIEPASVIGLSFAEQAVEALAPDDLRRELQAYLEGLTRKQLVRSIDDADEERIYRFDHLLIRDAAYQGLLKRARAELHEAFVAWADVINAERGRAQEFEEILGYHLEQAYRYRMELGPLDERGVTLGVRAAERLGSAGTRAIARGDMPAAASLLGRASSVLPTSHPDRPWLLIRTGEAKLELGEFAVAGELIDEAIEVATDLGDAPLVETARIERSRVRYLTDAAGSDAGLAAQVHQAIPVLEAADAQAGLARAWRLLTYIEGEATRWGAVEQAATAMLEHARLSGDRLMEIRGLPALAFSARLGPLPVPEALQRCEQLVARAEGDRRAEAIILRAIAHLRAMRGDFGEARELCRRVRNTLTELGWNFDAALVSIDSGPIELLAGDLAAAEAELRSDYQALDRLEERNYITTTAAYLAEALYRLGRLDEASEFASFSETTAADDDLLTQILWRAVRGKLLARSGRVEEASVVAREAVRLAQTSDDPTAQGNALVDLAEVLEAAGQQTEAEASLSAAIRRYEAKGNTVAAATSRDRLDSMRARAAAAR